MSERDAMVELVLKAQQGDEKAFHALVKKYEKLVYYIAVQHTRNSEDAKDIMQDTFIEVQRSIKNLHEPKYFKAWLNKVTFSKTTKLFAKRRDITLDQQSEADLEWISENRDYMVPEKAMKFKNEKELLQYCLDQLKPIQRQALMMFYFEELKMSEIAYILEIPEGTVKSRISFAKKELRKIVEEVQESHDFHFDFRVGAMESMLIACFVSAYTNIKVPVVLAKLPFKSFKATMIANPMVSIVTCATLASVGAVGGYRAYQSFQESSNPIVVNQSIQVEEEVFPTIAYDEQTITTARMAYTLLYEEVYLQEQELDSNDKATMQNVYKTLQDYGGMYYTMAQHLRIETRLLEKVN